MKKTLPPVSDRTYTEAVTETTVTGFGSPTILADNRPSAVFLRPYAFARPFIGWAWAGDLRVYRFQCPGLPTPPSARPPFGSGARVFNIDIGGRYAC